MSQQRRDRDRDKSRGRARPDRGKPGEDERVRELAKPLGRVLDRLPEIERRVVEMRMGLVDGHPRSVADIARELGMTNHEAKQVEERAFDRIREVVPLDRLQRLLEG